ncbi:hypothetical protein ACJDU8_07710 [Clostridium sp. WILCCON 0269]|uniref:Pilus assembly protein PilO n=1 Tax=Candidatus Clostridium eludens TaxID=3381663 RepID=A0ABW8SKV7_9CLOT
MEKNKRDLMILIALLFLGVNYASYNYFIKAQLNSAAQAKNKYITRKKELSDIKLKQQSIYTKQKEIEKLKQETADFDSIAPVKVDTPQLIYDFYNGCKLSGITGQSISFELLNNNSNNNNKTSNSTSNTNTSNTNTNSSTTVQNNQNNGKFYTLSIDLKVMGNKSNVENFVKGLGTITKRKLNVKSITISSQSSTASEGSNNGLDMGNQVPGNNTNTTNGNQTDTGVAQISDELFSEIIFYEYIQDEGNSQINVPGDYVFYDSQKEGFNSISDMFK